MRTDRKVNGFAAEMPKAAKSISVWAKGRKSYGAYRPAPRPRGGAEPHRRHAGAAPRRGAFPERRGHLPAAGRPQPHPYFLAAVPLRGVCGEHRGHGGNVQPRRVPPPAGAEGQRPAVQPPGGAGGVLPRRRHDPEPLAPRDDRAGDGCGVSPVAGGGGAGEDHPGDPRPPDRAYGAAGDHRWKRRRRCCGRRT